MYSKASLPEFAVLGLVTVEVGLVDLVDAAAETIGGELGSGGSGNQSLSDQSVFEDGGSFDLTVKLEITKLYDVLLKKIQVFLSFESFFDVFSERK